MVKQIGSQNKLSPLAEMAENLANVSSPLKYHFTVISLSIGTSYLLRCPKI